jgi:hypothetical protein
MQRLLLVTVALALAACGSDADESALLADSSRLVSSEYGEVGDTAVAMQHEVRSEDYRRWLEAQRALDSLPGIEPPDPISLRYATEDDIDRLTRELEADQRIRSAIESSGLSVRDYVLTGVALEQAMLASEPTRRTALMGIPPANTELARRNSDEIRRQTASTRFPILRDDDRRETRKAGKGQGKGKGKAKGKRKG